MVKGNQNESFNNNSNFNHPKTERKSTALPRNVQTSLLKNEKNLEKKTPKKESHQQHQKQSTVIKNIPVTIINSKTKNFDLKSQDYNTPRPIHKDLTHILDPNKEMQTITVDVRLEKIDKNKQYKNFIKSKLGKMNSRKSLQIKKDEGSAKKYIEMMQSNATIKGKDQILRSISMEKNKK